jgi:membrane-associated phospholipid phosphatase
MADAVSMTFVAAVAIPAGIWLGHSPATGLFVGDRWYAGLAVLVILQAVAIEVAKPYLTGLGTWTLRPAGARACDTLCRGGAAGGAPGFPSGHMAAATLMVVALWLHTRRPIVLWIGGPWIVAMAWARWAKECHSLVQIVGGAAVGATVGWSYAHLIGT